MKDIMGMMKQVQGLQAKMADMQAEMEAALYEGQSGGGMVRVSLSGKGALKRVSIDESLLQPAEREIVEDLIIAAHNDAKGKAVLRKPLTGELPFDLKAHNRFAEGIVDLAVDLPKVAPWSGET
ncbi:MAG: YbaB/EbfC family nucleoid-associated protein, partial [Beijerinckiaceae bacterium]|nr:YbaB/EbfC family nucleoid-associated protein [Beijerinckiaceae bacterium]